MVAARVPLRCRQAQQLARGTRAQLAAAAVVGRVRAAVVVIHKGSAQLQRGEERRVATRQRCSAQEVAESEYLGSSLSSYKS